MRSTSGVGRAGAVSGGARLPAVTGVLRNLAAMGMLALLAACVTAITTPEPIEDRFGAGSTALYMDAQEQTLRELLAESGVEVERIRDDILLRTPGLAAFEPDRAEVNPSFHDLLETLVEVLNQYDRTLIEVSGYTDPSGSMVRNMALSLQRAEAVVQLLEELGVAEARLAAKGLGPLHPFTDNATDEGRALNRRVELTIRPLVGVTPAAAVVQ